MALGRLRDQKSVGAEATATIAQPAGQLGEIVDVGIERDEEVVAESVVFRECQSCHVSNASSTTGVASANPTEDYRDAMTGFLPVIIDWTGEVQTAAHAAAMKPTPDRLAELDELAQRGEYILQDFRGTGTLVPAALRPAHSIVADMIGTLMSAAANADEDRVAAAEMVDGTLEWAQPAVRKIQNFTSGFGLVRPGETPDQPGLGS